MVLGYPAKHTLQSKRLFFFLYQCVEHPFTPLVNVILNSQQAIFGSWSTECGTCSHDTDELPRWTLLSTVTRSGLGGHG
jgi:hypothetical protein